MSDYVKNGGQRPSCVCQTDEKMRVQSPIWIKESMTISIESIMQPSKHARKS